MKHQFNKQQEKQLLNIREKSDKKAKVEVIAIMKEHNAFLKAFFGKE